MHTYLHSNVGIDDCCIGSIFRYSHCIGGRTLLPYPLSSAWFSVALKAPTQIERLQMECDIVCHQMCPRGCCRLKVHRHVPILIDTRAARFIRVIAVPIVLLVVGNMCGNYILSNVSSLLDSHNQLISEAQVLRNTTRTMRQENSSLHNAIKAVHQLQGHAFAAYASDCLRTLDGFAARLYDAAATYDAFLRESEVLSTTEWSLAHDIF